MWSSKKSVNLSIAVCYILSLILAVLVIAGPFIFKIYMTSYRGFEPYGESMKLLQKVFGFCFYPSSVFAAAVLFSLLKLLYNIKSGKIFTEVNVRYLKTVSLCCFAVALITFAGGFFYMPFMFIAFAGGFVGMLLRVLKNVMQSAVELREESDLTI